MGSIFQMWLKTYMAAVSFRSTSHPLAFTTGLCTHRLQEACTLLWEIRRWCEESSFLTCCCNLEVDSTEKISCVDWLPRRVLQIGRAYLACPLHLPWLGSVGAGCTMRWLSSYLMSGVWDARQGQECWAQLFYTPVLKAFGPSFPMAGHPV